MNTNKLTQATARNAIHNIVVIFNEKGEMNVINGQIAKTCAGPEECVIPGHK